MPDGRDGKDGTGRSPKARRRFQRRHAIFCLLPRIASTPATIGAIPSLVDEPGAQRLSKPCAGGAAINSTAPRRNGRGAVGGRQTALGLLRDQIRSCVPSSPSIRRA